MWFNVSYKLIKTCSICFNYEEENILSNSLLQITINDFNISKGFSEYLYNKFTKKFSICPTVHTTSTKTLKMMRNLLHV